MTYDSGEVKFFRKSNAAEPGRMPVAEYTQIMETCYSERTIGSYRYAQAKQFDVQLEGLIRIPRTYALKAGDAATLKPYSHEMDGEIFAVYQVQQVEDDDGLPATDVSLERFGGADAGKIIGIIS